MHVQEPAVRQAAALAIHWENKDIEAVVLLLAEITSQAEAEDIITALLMLRGRSVEDMYRLLVHV